jgi:hypothetical protein
MNPLLAAVLMPSSSLLCIALVLHAWRSKSQATHPSTQHHTPPPSEPKHQALPNPPLPQPASALGY